MVKTPIPVWRPSKTQCQYQLSLNYAYFDKQNSMVDYFVALPFFDFKISPYPFHTLYFISVGWEILLYPNYGPLY